MPTSKLKRKVHKTSRLPQYMVIGGVILIVVVLLVFKSNQEPGNSQLANSADISAEQLDRALQAGEPTLAFFHSDNCQQCIVMMATVAQVYPEFTGSVTLVDVNVYDEQNQALLKRVGLQYIPTLIFYDRSGQSKVFVGVMEAESLRQTLAYLEGGD